MKFSMDTHFKNAHDASFSAQPSFSDQPSFSSVVAAACIVPLVTYPKWIPMKGEWFEFWLNRTLELDSYSWGKSKLIQLLAFVILGCLSVYGWARSGSESFERKNSRFAPSEFVYFICFAVLYAGYLLATLFAEHTLMAYVGFPGRYEGFWVVSGYLIFALGAMVFASTPNRLHILLGGLFVSSVAVTYVGMTEYFRVNFWNTWLGRALSTIGQEAGYKQSFSFPDHFGWNAGSLYNTNYVGSYAALLLLLALGVCWALLDRLGGAKANDPTMAGPLVLSRGLFSNCYWYQFL
jgi:hypothetical protein